MSARLAVEALQVIAATGVVQPTHATGLALAARSLGGVLLGAGDVRAGAVVVRLAAAVEAADDHHLARLTAELAATVLESSSAVTSAEAMGG